jgi:tetratricopeptide (TPR) repeat protein
MAGRRISPCTGGMDQLTAAEVTLRAGVLTGWIGSCKQIEGAQETAKNLISESLTKFEALGETEKVAEAQTEAAYCYWRQGSLHEARVWLQEALGRLPDDKDKEVNEVRAVALLRLAIVENSAQDSTTPSASTWKQRLFSREVPIMRSKEDSISDLAMCSGISARQNAARTT